MWSNNVSWLLICVIFNILGKYNTVEILRRNHSLKTRLKNYQTIKFIKNIFTVNSQSYQPLSVVQTYASRFSNLLASKNNLTFSFCSFSEVYRHILDAISFALQGTNEVLILHKSFSSVNASSESFGCYFLICQYFWLYLSLTTGYPVPPQPLQQQRCLPS